MYHRYTDLEKHFVLQRLVANGYDVHLTVTQTGVPENTVRRWRTKLLPPTPPYFRGESSLTIPPPFPPLPASESQALRDIQRQLMEMVNRLSHSIEEAIDDAPLIQRAAALSQFIDRVIKISAQLPPDPQDYLIEDDDGEEPDGETEYAQTPRQTAADYQ